MTRRALLAGATGVGAGSALGAVPIVTKPPSLRKAAGAVGLLYGATAETDLRHAPPAYCDLMAAQCALLAPNLSWGNVSPAPDKIILEPDKNVDFARAHGLALTGAHLLWYLRTPSWFEQLGSAEAARAIVDHVNEMTRHYVEQTFSWNVVNEAIQPTDGRADGLRNSAFLRMLGPEYFDAAFHAARRGDPGAILAYNDYNMEMDNPIHEARRTALLKLLDGLQHRAVPIDAVGLQSHLVIRNFQFNEAIYSRFLREIAGRGLKIILSELDVLDIGAPSGVAERDAAVAQIYDRFLSVALDERAVIAVVTWGLSDKYTWLTPAYSPRFRRSDGLPTRPLPFDADLKPTPALFAIEAAFRRAPPHPMATRRGQTSAGGFRAGPPRGELAPR